MGAAPSRLLADLPAGAAASPNRDIRQGLVVLRARSRWLAQNDGFSKGFLRMLRRNVVGPQGFTLQMRVKDDRDPKKQDAAANDRIEAAWQEWCRKGVCEASRKLSFTMLHQKLVVGLARDGEYLLRKLRGTRWNRFGFALQILDPSLLDENLTVGGGAATTAYGYRLPAGHMIRMGVELDAYQAPVAYHLRTNLPGDDVYRTASSTYVRVPAEEIIHCFLSDWPDQARGVPWFDAALRRLAMLDGYAESELVAARVSADKMGFYKMAQGADPDEVPADLKQDGNFVQESTAGSWEILPYGYEVQEFDPQHPNQAFKDFVSANLRGAAAAVGTSYNAFANDAAGMNYSALRSTELEDRDEWETLQGNEIEGFLLPLFEDWLRSALIADALGGLPPGKFWKFNAPTFIGRGWDWVDPQNEVGAAKEAVALGIASRTQIVARRGGDFSTTVADLKREQIEMEGLPTLQPSAPAPPRPAEPATPAT
jgi:lambda family phage portal protein